MDCRTQLYICNFIVKRKDLYNDTSGEKKQWTLLFICTGHSEGNVIDPGSDLV